MMGCSSELARERPPPPTKIPQGSLLIPFMGILKLYKSTTSAASTAASSAPCVRAEETGWTAHADSSFTADAPGGLSQSA